MSDLPDSSIPKATHPESLLRKARRIGKVLNSIARVWPSLAGKLTFRLFCTPRKNEIRSKDLEFLTSAEQATLEVEGLRIRTYTWYPALQPAAGRVVFVHGWESNSARWRKYIKALRGAGWVVSAFDAPAHGQSEGRQINLPLYSRVLKAYMEETGTPDVLIGHSLGAGAIAMSLAALDGPRPSKAILLGAFASTLRVVHDFGNLLCLNAQTMQATDNEVHRRSGRRFADYSVEKMVAELHDVQGLVIHDRNDDVAPVAEGRSLARAWGVPFLETEGLGHRMQHRRVVEAVTQFVMAGQLEVA
jgi:pimeloyl-ACP methyl ester carboxylesterase